MSRKKEYPGYLLYFDQMEGLVSVLNDEELGLIHRAIYYYARERKEPENLPDKFALIWPAIQNNLDRDREAYEGKCRSNAYSAAARVSKQKGEQPPDREVFNAAYDKKYGTGQTLKEDVFEEMRKEAINKLRNISMNKNI